MPQFKALVKLVLLTTDWPFIQLYDLSIETFEVVLEQAGADEVVTINYDSGDMDDYASLVLDRNSVPHKNLMSI